MCIGILSKPYIRNLPSFFKFHINLISLLCSFHLKDFVENHIFFFYVIYLIFSDTIQFLTVSDIFCDVPSYPIHVLLYLTSLLFTNTVFLYKRCVVLDWSMNIVLNACYRFTITETWGRRGQIKTHTYNWIQLAINEVNWWNRVYRCKVNYFFSIVINAFLYYTCSHV